MKTLKTKTMAVLVFASLTGLVLLGFQNCSSSLAVLGFAKAAKVSDVSEMLKSSYVELDSTTRKLKSKSREINSVPKEETVLVYGEVKDPEEIKKQIAAKLDQKKNRK